jgi:hypothetical protein
MRKIKIIYFVSALALCCAVHSTTNAQVVRQQKTERQRGREVLPASRQNERAKYQEIVNKSKKVSEEAAKKSNENRSNVNQANISRPPVTPMNNRTQTKSKQSYQQLVQNLQKRNDIAQAQPNRALAKNNAQASPQERYRLYVQKAEADKRQIEKDRMNRQ